MEEDPMSEYPSYQPEATPPAKTSGMAIASLVTGIFGFSLIAIILGFIARKQIRESMGAQTGEGLALAGIILGFVWLALSVICVCVVVALSISSSSYYY
jgi:hypothetical protein